MRYSLLVYSDQSDWADMPEQDAAAAREAAMPGWLVAFAELGKADPGMVSRELEPADTAKVVRVRDGQALVTDGPFAETKEQIGGVFVTELPDLDEAIRLAALVPAATYGSMEIRPIVE